LKQVVARGRGTFEHLGSFGLSNVVEGADLAFRMDTDADDERTAAGLVSDLSDGFFVVSASSVVEELCAKQDIDSSRLMSDLITRLVEETGLSAVLVAHSARPGHPKSRMNDLPIIVEIGELSAHPRVKIVEESLDPRVLRALIARGEFLLASRFHAMISGLATGTPTIVVGWSHKYREVMEEFGLGDFVVAFSEFNVETLFKLSTEAWKRRSDLSGQMAAVLPTVRDSAESSLRSLRSAIDV
jgi:polysaccharide pyruvyl transferase WcaK-like protein